MKGRLDLMQTTLQLFGCFRKIFNSRFANELYTLVTLYNRLNAKILARFRKNMKTRESVKRNAELFL